MSREIKFRAWDTNTDDWFHNAFEKEKLFGCISGYKHNSERGFAEIHQNQDHPEYTLEQYTGLKDKNGKEIYEGDILKVVSKVEPEFKAGAVAMQQQQFIVMNVLTYSSPELTHCEWLGRYTESELEIIGNIHENPELLEGEK